MVAREEGVRCGQNGVYRHPVMELISPGNKRHTIENMAKNIVIALYGDTQYLHCGEHNI